MDGKHVVSKHGRLPPEPYPRHSESVLATAVYMPNSAISIGIEYYLGPSMMVKDLKESTYDFCDDSGDGVCIKACRKPRIITGFLYWQHCLSRHFHGDEIIYPE
jgi:hypothetical protein